jgi:glucokinase
MLDLVDRERFLDIFRSKGPMSSWMEDVGVKIVLDPELSLHGAVNAASFMVEKQDEQDR